MRARAKLTTKALFLVLILLATIPMPILAIDEVVDNYTDETKVAGKHQVVRNTTYDAMELLLGATGSWIGGFDYRRQINVSGSHSGPLSDYVIEVFVSYNYTENTFVAWEKDYNNPILDTGDIYPGEDSHVWNAAWYNGTHVIMLCGHYDAGTDIYAYISADQENFVGYGPNPVITRAQVQTALGLGGTPTALEPHSIIPHGTSYWLYYGYKLAGVWYIGLANSTDLLTWGLYGTIILSPGGGPETSCADPHVTYDHIQGNYKLLYASGTPWDLWGAHSNDGLTWTREGKLASGQVPIDIWNASGGVYGLLRNYWGEGYTYYTVKFNSSSENVGDYQFIGYDNALTYDPDNAWEDTNLGHGDVIQIGSEWVLYYVGHAGANDFKIGIARLQTTHGFKISLDEKCAVDLSDITFTDSDGETEIDYYLDTTRQGAKGWGFFYVEIPDLPSAGTSIYMYYGSGSPITGSDGEDTFLFFDDFETDLSKWTELEAGTADVSLDGTYQVEGNKSVKLADPDNANPAGIKNFDMITGSKRVYFWIRTDGIDATDTISTIYRDGDDSDFNVWGAFNFNAPEAWRNYIVSWITFAAGVQTINTWHRCELLINTTSHKFIPHHDYFGYGNGEIGMRNLASADTGLWIQTAAASFGYNVWVDLVYIDEWVGGVEISEWGEESSGELGYLSEGHFYTTDILSGISYNATAVLLNTTIPGDDGITVEFSEDNSTWTLNDWAPIFGGYEAVDLRELGYSTMYFRFNFTDGGADSTPRLYQLRLIHEAPCVGNGDIINIGSQGIFALLLCIIIPIVAYVVKKR